MKKLILYIVLMCVSCFATSQMPVEFRSCKLVNSSKNVTISCKIYNEDYALTGGNSYIGSYKFTTDKHLYECKENIFVNSTKHRIVNEVQLHYSTTNTVFVSHSIYDKHGVKIERDYKSIKNFCSNTYNKLTKYID